jgi:hypothetical protein
MMPSISMRQPGDLGLCHGSEADEAADLDHVGQKGMFSTAEFFYTFYDDQVGPDAADPGTHAVEHEAKLLEIGFAGGVVDGGGAFGEYGGHDDVGGAGHRCFIQEHVAAFECGGVDMEEVLAGVEVELGAELLEAEEMGIEAPAADLVASRFGEAGFAEAGEDGAKQHDRPAECGGLFAIFFRFKERGVDLCGVEPVGAGTELLDFAPEVANELDELIDVHNIGEVVDGDGLSRQEYSADNL